MRVNSLCWLDLSKSLSLDGTMKTFAIKFTLDRLFTWGSVYGLEAMPMIV